MIDPRWYQLVNMSIWLNGLGKPVYAMRLYDSMAQGRIYHLRSKFGGRVKIIVAHCQFIDTEYVDMKIDEIVTSGRIDLERREGAIKFNDRRLHGVTLYGDRTRPVGNIHPIDDSCFPMRFVSEQEWSDAYNASDITQE